MAAVGGLSILTTEASLEKEARDSHGNGKAVNWEKADATSEIGRDIYSSLTWRKEPLAPLIRGDLGCLACNHLTLSTPLQDDYLIYQKKGGSGKISTF